MNNKAISILLVEDKSSDGYIKQVLSGSFETVKFDTEAVSELSGAINLLNYKSFDVVLLDLELSDSCESDAIKKIHALSPDIPVIVLTESANEESGIQAIKNGADDYLVRGKIFRDVLGRSIRYGIERRKERKLAEGKLTKLIEELESVNKELKDFAYIISHDLKAPLRGIKILVNWIATDYADKLDVDSKEQLLLLKSRVSRMHNLIDGVLQYSRIGRVREEQKQVYLQKLVPEIIDIVNINQNIEIEIETELPTILCEQTCITQVFQNLLSNAVKYMDKPNGQIKIGCIEQDNCWEFYVSDNGPGIEEKNLERIFQIFQTLAPRDIFESTGVGLTIARKIVERYEGKIWAESEVGRGSTFFFTLPLQKERMKSCV